MTRDLARLADESFDLCVVGGGIYGVCAAWEAALRGLSVALVEKDDFGHATSFNSQNTIHGGFRYLQGFDVPRLRAAVRERRAWMRIAPHLVQPMPFLIPIYRGRGKAKPLFRVAVRVYDLLSADRNSLDDPSKRIPAGRILSRDDTLARLPGVEADGLTGGALYHDALIHNSERLGMAIVRAAAHEGAAVANHLEATSIVRDGARVTGVRVRDRLGDAAFDVRATTVLNMAGPWVDRLLSDCGDAAEPAPLLKVMYLALRRPVLSSAVALIDDRGKYFFTIPWHGHTLLGVSERAAEGDRPDTLRFGEEEIERFLARIAGTRPALGIRREDVVSVRGGLLPTDPGSVRRGAPELPTTARVIDHGRHGGPEGLISVAGHKYTMARAVAERVVGRVVATSDRLCAPSRSEHARAFGGEIERFDEFVAQAVDRAAPHLDQASARHLALNYGSEHGRVVDCAGDDTTLLSPLGAGSPVIGAEVVHALREEMAETLADVVFRRTELGVLGHPGDDALDACAAIAARERAWPDERRRRELDDVRVRLDAYDASLRSPAGAARD